MTDEPSPGHALFGFAYAIAVIAAVGYFTYAAIQGEHGTFRKMQVEAQSGQLQAELAALRAERAVLENRTRRMSAKFLDLDLLDERARAVLGLARGDELIIR